MKFLTIATTVVIMATFVGPVFAQTVTETANDLRDSVKQQVEQEMSQIQKAVSKKAFLGSITSKNEAAINITNYQGQPRQALVTTDTVIRLKNGRDGTPKDLTVGDYLLIMGEVDSKNVMTAKRLLVVATPTEDTRTVNFGRVTEISTASVTIETSDKKTVTAKLQSSTSINTTLDGASVKAKIADITSGSNLVIITRSGTAPTAINVHIVSAPASTPNPTTTP